MFSNTTGHEKLIKVILNEKKTLKLNFQELEELSFALTDRIISLKQKDCDIRYLKSIRRLLTKIENKIDDF